MGTQASTSFSAENPILPAAKSSALVDVIVITPSRASDFSHDNMYFSARKEAAA